MGELPNPFNTLKALANSKKHYYSLSALEETQKNRISRLPVTIRIMIESLLRHCDGQLVKEKDIINLMQWNATNPSSSDIPFVVSRVILQDFTGVPLLVDLAAMRDAMAERNLDPACIEPQVPVDLVVDHSVQVDRAGTKDAFGFNLKTEFKRNNERYSFLKWGQEAFNTLQIIPPGVGIVHQVNLEYLASVVIEKIIEEKTILYPDTLVGTDSHTTMINGLGVLGWGVGGIEAEAAMLGQPVFLQSPEVIGLHFSGKLGEGITATDLTLAVTQLLRKEKVVGKFVEFFGEGAASLSVADRATLANMAPEYGATVGFFSVDEKTLEYLRMTGRNEAQIRQIKEYLIAQKLFGIPRKDDIIYTKTLELDLSSIVPCVSGPKRPQDHVALSDVKKNFKDLLNTPVASRGYGIAPQDQQKRIGIHAGGYFSLDIPHDMGGTSILEDGKAPSTWSEAEMVTNRPMTPAVANPGYLEEKDCDIILQHGSIVIAAITSCTNTSNPNVMIAAGLVAKKALERGLKVNPMVKTSLAPGSRVVTDYLEKTGLQKSLDTLGFQLVAYGCTTCIGNSGPLEEKIENAIKDHDLVVASVLSGNRNFEARIHSAVKANFLMSPPLVVAFAIAGRIDIDMENEPLGIGKEGPVFLRDIWPTDEEISKTVSEGIQPDMFKKRYSKVLEGDSSWTDITVKGASQYNWSDKSSYIRKPPYFEGVTAQFPVLHTYLKNMRPLALFGDSVTTDHISPAGAFYADSPAGQYLISLGIPETEFNSYGSRRGNHEVMLRGTFANVRLRNKMAQGREGGFTRFMPDGVEMTIFDASKAYAAAKVPLIIFAGKDYGMGSSRDWAAKGTALLGVKVVVARSFERIHRTNLIGMGVLPLQFVNEDDLERFDITGEELFSLHAIEMQSSPGGKVILEMEKNGQKKEIELLSRLDTPSEVEYYRHGGILPFILRQYL